MNKKNYETYNNEREETCFCKEQQVSDRKRQKASNSQEVTYTWQLSPGISFVREVLVVNSKSVVHKDR